MKKKYVYNPKTLAYEKVEQSLFSRAFKLFLYFSPGIIVGLTVGIFFFSKYNKAGNSYRNSEILKYQKELELMQNDMKLINSVLEELERKDKDLYRAALHAEEFPEELREMGQGGSDKFARFDALSDGQLFKENAKRINQLERRLSAQSTSFAELLKLAKVNDKSLRCIPSIQPVNDKELKQMASGYGMRIDPIYGIAQMHDGMDFSAEIGTDVYATADGVIESVERNEWGYGQCIVINHGFGYRTRYAHLSAFKVKQGQKVQRGDLIGLIGTTGKSTGPHLHYEVEENGVKVNPVFFYHYDLTPEQYEKMIKKSQENLKSLD